MSPLALLVSLFLTLVLHSTVALGAVWLSERLGWLRHPGWAELAWRAALFGALLSASLAGARMILAWAELQADAPAARVTVSAPAAPTADPAARPARTEPVANAAAQTRVLPATAANASEQAVNATRETAPGPATTLALPDLGALALLSAWVLAMGFAGLRLLGQGWGLQRLRRRVRRSGRAAAPGLQHEAATLAARLGLRAPALRTLPGLSGPLLMPGATVLLPDWTEALAPAQQRALLAHELGHLQRHDPAWRLAQRLVLLPLGFHPLARHAVHRLEALAEDACDAHAARLLGSGRPLAECLAACLSHAGARAGHPALAVAMAGDAGPVVRRVQNLLEESAMNLRPLSPGLRRTAIVLALAALVTLPGLAVSTFASEGLGDRISSRLGLDGRHNYRYADNGVNHRVELELTGDVTFNEAETDVAKLGPGARLRIEEARDGVEHELRVALRDGKLQHRYWRDGEERPLDADGRAWLSTTLPALLRETGINAEARGQRLLAQGGPAALMAEIAKVKADHARARYLAVLFEHATLDEAMLDQALDLAKAIGSDFELRRVLQDAPSRQPFSPAQQAQLLRIAPQLESDFELAELLVAWADELGFDAQTLPAWRTALEALGSDFETRRALHAVIARSGSDPQALVLALGVAKGIGSDFELRSVLVDAAPHARGDAEVLAAFLERVGDVGSDFELRQSLVALIEAGEVDVAIATGVIDATRLIDSDFEVGQVLLPLAGAMPADAALIEHYRTAARRLGDHERGQAERALDRFVVAQVD